MKTDLTKATFIIPIRIESQDRLRNVLTVTAFLLDNFDTNIIIKEVDSESVFEKNVLPHLKEYFDDLSSLTHVFEKSDDSTFHRQKILNEMIAMSDTEIVVNYDCDVILPLESYTSAYNGVLDKIYDIIYPYGQGEYQKQVTATDGLVSKFIRDKDFSLLDSSSNVHTSDFGWAQFFNRQVYIDGGMENENFVAYAPEDKERFYRFAMLGYNIGRVQDFVYHLEHARGQNSWITNPHMEINDHEWIKVGNMNKEQIKEYYSNQEYLKKYVSV
jgi:hypothetical protein